jgi:hypothetical protein
MPRPSGNARGRVGWVRGWVQVCVCVCVCSVLFITRARRAPCSHDLALPICTHTAMHHRFEDVKDPSDLRGPVRNMLKKRDKGLDPPLQAGAKWSYRIQTRTHTGRPQTYRHGHIQRQEPRKKNHTHTHSLTHTNSLSLSPSLRCKKRLISLWLR